MSAIYLSVFILGLGMALAYIVHQQSVQEKEKSLRREYQVYAKTLKTQITQGLESCCLALDRMARHWEMVGGTPREEWEYDARRLVEHLGGIQAIEWVDRTNHVRWIVPGEESEEDIGLDLSKQEHGREALARARLSGTIQVSHLTVLRGGRRGVLIFVPILTKRGIDSFIVGELGFRPALDQVFASVASRFSVVVYAQSHEVYRWMVCPPERERKWGQREPIEAHGASWEVVVTPSAEILRNSFSRFSGMILPFGCLLSLLLAVAAYLGQSSYLSCLKLETAQTELRSHRDRLEYLVEERTLELQEAKEEAESANRAKTDFLARMSHDLRTPISGVSGNVTLLQTTDLDEIQRGYVLSAEASANALLEQINEILDLSRIEAGQITFQTAPFDLLRVVERTAQLVSPRACAKGLELIVQYGPTCPRYVIGDARRVRQILMNLLSNAVKFTSGGEISITVQAETQSEVSTMFSFQVKDTGIGIPADQMGRIFDQYVQVGESEGGKYGGSGLGLTICKQLAEFLGGSITIQSESGQGTSFDVCLPLMQNPEAPQTRAAAENLKGVRLLVADMNQTVCEALSEQAQHWGLEVATASSCEEFLQVLVSGEERGAPIQMAVMGCKPDLAECKKMARQLQDDPATSDLILIAAVSAESGVGIEELKGVGFRGYVSKPVQQAHLLNVLERCLALRNGEEDSGFIVGHVNSEPGGTRPELVRKIPGAASATILVVDDNSITREIAVRMLESFGCMVEAVSSGLDAFQVVRHNKCDLILMDCKMPEMDGYETTRQIRRIERDGQSVPIIALTGNAIPEDRGRCLQAGMDDYIQKPLTFDDLRAVLEEWLPLNNQHVEPPVVELHPQAEADTKPVETVASDAKPDQTNSDILDGPTEELIVRANQVPHEGTSGPLDRDALERIGTIAKGRSAFLHQLIDRYVKEGQKHLGEMPGWIRDGNREALKQTAHAYKGASAQVGASRLHYLCGQIETTAESGSLSHVNDWLAEFDRELDAFAESFRAHFFDG